MYKTKLAKYIGSPITFRGENGSENSTRRFAMDHKTIVITGSVPPKFFQYTTISIMLKTAPQIANIMKIIMKIIKEINVTAVRGCCVWKRNLKEKRTTILKAMRTNVEAPQIKFAITTLLLFSIGVLLCETF